MKLKGAGCLMSGFGYMFSPGIETEPGGRGCLIKSVFSYTLSPGVETECRGARCLMKVCLVIYFPPG